MESESKAVTEHRRSHGIPVFTTTTEGQRTLSGHTDYRGTWRQGDSTVHYCAADGRDAGACWHSSKRAALSCAMRAWQRQRA